MKKFFVLLLVAIIIISCSEKETSLLNFDKIPKNLSSPGIDLIQNSGNIHNNTCQFILDNLPPSFDPGNQDDFEYLVNLINYYQNQNYDFDTLTTNPHDFLQQVGYGPFVYDTLKAIWNYDILNYIWISDSVGYEVGLINNAITFLNNQIVDTIHTNSQKLNLIVDYADSLIDIWDNHNWNQTCISGELSGGFFHILKSSAQYWNQYLSFIENSKNQKPQWLLLLGFVCKVVASDATGYIGGWVGACAKEIYENGKLDQKNEKTRIGVGVGCATGNSTRSALGG